MRNAQQTTANSGFLANRGAVNIHRNSVTSVPFSEPRKKLAALQSVGAFDSKALTHSCPCCGSALKNQRPFIDVSNHTFVIGDVAVRLRPKHAQLLGMLLDSYPRTAGHDHLIGALWDDAEPEDARNNIKVFINQIRTSLAGLAVAIRNVQGVGYRIDFNTGRGQ